VADLGFGGGTRAPHFALARHGVWQTLSLRQTIQSCEDYSRIVTNTQQATEGVLTVIWQNRCRSTMIWILIRWRMLALDKAEGKRRVEGARNAQFGESSPEAHLVLQAMQAWKVVATLRRQAKADAEVKVRIEQARSLRIDLRQLEMDSEDIACDLEIASHSEAMSARQLEQTIAQRKELADRTNARNPVQMRTSLEHVARTTCDSAVESWGLGNVRMKWALRARSNLLTFMKPDRQTLRSVANLPYDHVVIRWLNFAISEAKHCASGVMEGRQPGKEDLDDLMDGSWSAGKDIALFKRRCQKVRSIETPLRFLSDSPSTSYALGTVCAMMNAYARDTNIMDPASLWPLDEGNAEQRAAAVHRCLLCLAPTRAAGSLLKEEDVLRGKPDVLMPFLAAVFTARPPGLPDNPEALQTFGLLRGESEEAGAGETCAMRPPRGSRTRTRGTSSPPPC